jgi:hypothetical protein
MKPYTDGYVCGFRPQTTMELVVVFQSQLLRRLIPSDWLTIQEKLQIPWFDTLDMRKCIKDLVQLRVLFDLEKAVSAWLRMCVGRNVDDKMTRFKGAASCAWTDPKIHTTDRMTCAHHRSKTKDINCRRPLGRGAPEHLDARHSNAFFWESCASTSSYSLSDALSIGLSSTSDMVVCPATNKDASVRPKHIENIFLISSGYSSVIGRHWSRFWSHLTNTTSNSLSNRSG